MAKTRQQKHSDEVRSRILTIARGIITEAGVEGLSIRKITKEMDYSAGIVYHYFKNKEEIISCILKEGYTKIIQSVTRPDGKLPPDEEFRVTILNFIDAISSWQHEYKAIMLNSSPQILEFTSVLHEGSCQTHPAMMAMVSNIECGIAGGIYAPCDAELTAQAIWSAIFGLQIRLTIEQKVTPEHRQKLIERQIEIILKGLKL
jgi:AcrR family transcriptional regulator